jgi:uncharacterized membrane protein YqjE
MNNSTQQPLLADLRAGIAALGGELREMVSARLELAQLEIQSDLLSAKRLAVAWLVAVVMSLTALPLVAVWMAEVLAEQTGIARGGWLLGFAAALLFLAGLGGYLAWRRFCRNFLGLRETLEELHEDVLWLKEKGADAPAGTADCRPDSAPQAE